MRQNIVDLLPSLFELNLASNRIPEIPPWINLAERKDIHNEKVLIICKGRMIIDCMKGTGFFFMFSSFFLFFFAKGKYEIAWLLQFHFVQFLMTLR